MLEVVVQLTEQLQDEKQQIFIFSGAVIASDKFINMEQVRKINMTRIEQMYGKNMKITRSTEKELLCLQNVDMAV